MFDKRTLVIAILAGIAWLLFYATFNYSANWELLVIYFLMGLVTTLAYIRYWRTVYVLSASLATGILIFSNPVFGGIAVVISILAYALNPLFRKSFLLWWRKADFLSILASCALDLME